jgi:hypothetical protein
MSARCPSTGISRSSDIARSGRRSASSSAPFTHEYARIDADTVIRILREHLEDFRRFEAEALGWL